MNINWSILIANNLISAHRRERIQALIYALLGDIVRRHTDIVGWADRSRRQAAYSWQTASLEQLIYEESGMRISIGEGDGKPYDFIVNINEDSQLNEARLNALISKYKLAGKSFRLANSAVSFTIGFTDYVCERKEETYDIVFVSHICEQTEPEYSIGFRDHVCEKQHERDVNVISAYYSNIGDNLTVTVVSGYPVTSDIDVYFGAGRHITLLSGLSTVTRLVPWGDTPGIVSILPTEDSTYIYTTIIS